MKKLRLKKHAKVMEHDPFESLLDEKLIVQAFCECLEDNDPKAAIEILSSHLRAKGHRLPNGPKPF